MEPESAQSSAVGGYFVLCLTWLLVGFVVCVGWKLGELAFNKVTGSDVKMSKRMMEFVTKLYRNLTRGANEVSDEGNNKKK